MSSAKDDSVERWSRRDAAYLVIVVVVALVLRAIYLYQVRSCPFYGNELVDPKYYRAWGEAIAAGETFVAGPYFRAPLYPWFLGLIYTLFGRSDLAPRLIQIIVGSLSCGLVYLLGRRVYDRRVGIIAGLAAATYWVFLYFESELLIVWLAVFLDLLLIWLLLRAADDERAWPWMLCGGVLGVSALARPNVLLFAPAVIIWQVVLFWPKVRRALLRAACFSAGVAIFILPVTVRNYIVEDDLVLISSSAGVNFYIGNNPRSDGMTAMIAGMPGEVGPAYQAQVGRAEEAVGHKLTASQVSRYYFGEALSFLWDHPGQAAGLMARKLAYFWSRWEIANNQDPRFVTENFTPVVGLLPLSFAMVGPLGLLGLVLSFRRARRLFPLWGFVLVYMVSVVLFFVTARFRVPVVPVLMVLGAHALLWCVGAVRGRQWRSLAAAAGVLIVAAVLVAPIPPGVEAGVAQSYAMAGIALGNEGKIAEAESYLLESVRRFEPQPKAWFTLAMLSMQQRDYAKAEHYLSKTLTYDPAHPDARKHLAFVLSQTGRPGDAIALYRQVLKMSPDDAKVWTNLGGMLIQQSRMDEGIDALIKGVRLDRTQAGRISSTAQALARLGRLGDARRVLEAGVEALPHNVKTMSSLAIWLATAPDTRYRDVPRAKGLARRACELSRWSSATALDALGAAEFASGNVVEAIDLARRAADLAVSQGRDRQAEHIRKRLGLYESRLGAQRSRGRPGGSGP